MSETKNQSSNANSSLQSTRQLLDELDVMMKQMLEAPGEDSSAGIEQATSTITEPLSKDFDEPNEIVRDEAFPELPPTPTFPGYLHEQEPEQPPEPEEPPQQKAPGSTAKVMADTLVEQGKRAEPESVEVEAKPNPVSNRPTLTSPLIQPRRRWWFWPLNVVNLAFDAITYLFGPLGAWARNPTGRNVLGWFGLALLVTAVVWQVLLWTIWK